MCIYVFIYTLYITLFFIHSPIEKCLGCFYIFSIVNNAAMNMGVHISFGYPGFIFLRYIPKSGIPGSYGSSI